MADAHKQERNRQYLAMPAAGNLIKESFRFTKNILGVTIINKKIKT
jgi:hypothetical protein